MVFDSDRSITWLQDANYAASELTDGRRDAIIQQVINVDGHVLLAADFEKVANTYTGRMTWWGAVAWAEALTHSGYSDWRLARTAQPDPTCSQQIPHIPWSQGFDCRNGELGHLYYVHFGVSASTDMTGNQIVDNATLLNIESDYLTGDTVPGLQGSGDFLFTNGWQSNSGFQFYRHAWAVRDGDVEVAAVPVPMTLALIVSGLAALSLSRRRSATSLG